MDKDLQWECDPDNLANNNQSFFDFTVESELNMLWWKKGHLLLANMIEQCSQEKIEPFPSSDVFYCSLRNERHILSERKFCNVFTFNTIMTIHQILKEHVNCG